MIEVRNLTKKYGDKLAVNDISFKVEKGEILGFLGPNGAGKSTTMNMLTGYISSTSGEVLIDGIDILEEPKKAKSKIGYLPEIPPIYIDMTVEGYLSYMCIAPSLFFVCVMSAYRGYQQGLRNMVPTAISQLIEQIGRVFIVLHGPDEEHPFVPVEVTKEAKSFYSWINDHIWDLNRMQKGSEEIAAETGEQCSKPYECWYYGYCHGEIREPEQMRIGGC